MGALFNPLGQHLREGDATMSAQGALHADSDGFALHHLPLGEVLGLTEQVAITLHAHQLLLQKLVPCILVISRICAPSQRSQGRGTLGQIDPQIGIWLVQ